MDDEVIDDLEAVARFHREEPAPSRQRGREQAFFPGTVGEELGPGLALPADLDLVHGVVGSEELGASPVVSTCGCRPGGRVVVVVLVVVVGGTVVVVAIVVDGGGAVVDGAAATAPSSRSPPSPDVHAAATRAKVMITRERRAPIRRYLLGSRQPTSDPSLPDEVLVRRRWNPARR